MATYKTQGVIMRRANFGEADRLITVLTNSRGKLRAVARSARRPTAKMAGSLEILMRAEFRFAEGKNLDLVIESNPIDFYPNIRANLDKFKLASLLAEIVDKVSADNEPVKGFYELLGEYLKFIDGSNEFTVQLVVSSFELRLLRLLGYGPQLSICAVGGEPLIPGQNFWSSSQGGVVCVKHKGGLDRIVAVADNTIKFLRITLIKSIAELDKLTIPAPTQDEFHNIVEDFFGFHFDVKLKSRKYVDNLDRG